MPEIRPGVRRLFQWMTRSPAAARADADDELDAIIDSQTDYLVSLGMTPEAAKAEALRKLGTSINDARYSLRSSVEHKERRMRLNDLVDGIAHDIRYALRGLRLKPGFTAGVVVTLGLGVGANATMFGIVDRLLFRPPAYLVGADRTGRVYIPRTYRGSETLNNSFSYRRYLDIRNTTTSFDAMAPCYARRMPI